MLLFDEGDMILQGEGMEELRSRHFLEISI